MINYTARKISMEENKTTENPQNLPALAAQELTETADALENLAAHEEETADALMAGLEIKDEDAPKIKRTVHEFVTDYARKDADTTDTQFLVKKFSGYPKLWRDQAEMEQTATDIVETVYAYEKNRAELDAHIAA